MPRKEVLEVQFWEEKHHPMGWVTVELDCDIELVPEVWGWNEVVIQCYFGTRKPIPEGEMWEPRIQIKLGQVNATK